MSKYDIRHKETLRLFLKEYFELFFYDLSKKMNFEKSIFLDKELLGILEGKSPDVKKQTDALILVELEIDNQKDWILIHWEQQTKRKRDFEKRMFRYYCGIYFKYGKIIFPIAMFTDNANWKKPVKNQYEISLLNYPI